MKPETVDTELLHEVWKASHNKPGWIVDMKDDGVSADVIDMLQAYDDMMMDYNKRMTDEYYRIYKKEFYPKIEGHRREMDDDMRLYVAASLVNTLSDMKADKSEWDGELYDDFERTKKLTRTWIAQSSPEYRNLKSGIKRIESRLANPHKHDELTDFDIDSARHIDIRDFLVVDKRGYAVCPFHEDARPSLYTRGGFGYCFVCNKRYNAIDITMKMNGITFKEAVRSLL